MDDKIFELVVLSVCAEDVQQYASPEQLKYIESEGLMAEVMGRARDYMWDAIDCSDFFSDCMYEAVENTIRLAKGTGKKLCEWEES